MLRYSPGPEPLLPIRVWNPPAESKHSTSPSRVATTTAYLLPFDVAATTGARLATGRFVNSRMATVSITTLPHTSHRGLSPEQPRAERAPAAWHNHIRRRAFGRNDISPSPVVRVDAAVYGTATRSSSSLHCPQTRAGGSLTDSCAGRPEPETSAGRTVSRTPGGFQRRLPGLEHACSRSMVFCPALDDSSRRLRGRTSVPGRSGCGPLHRRHG